MIRLGLVLVLLAGFPLAALAEGGEPRDEKRAYRIVGAERVDPDDLEQAAKRELRKLRRTRRDVYADDAAFMMEVHLQTQGYALARVDWDDEEWVFVVREGPRFFLGDVTVTGSKVADPDDLAAFVEAPTTWYFGIGSRILLVDNLETGASRMAAWLRQQGYVDARVSDPITRPSFEELAERTDLPEEITLDVRYKVEDGPHATLTTLGITVSGAGAHLRKGIRETSERLLGRPWTPFSTYRIQSLVTDYLAEHGYPFAAAEVESEERMTRNRIEVDAQVTVVTGPVVTIGSVVIHGNRRTKDHVIRRELEFSPGSLFGTVPIRESQRNLFDLGYFRQASIELDETDLDRDVARKQEELTLDMDVGIEEGDLRRLDFSIGYGSWEGVRGSVSYTIFNVFASAYDLTTELGASQKNRRFLVRAENPWLLNPRIRGTAEASAEREERPTFEYTRLGFLAGLSKKFDRKHEIFTRWTFTKTDVYEVSGELPREFTNVTTVSSLTVGVISDTRVTKWEPRKGSYLATSLQWASGAIGSELDFLRPRAGARGYRRLFGSWILAWRAEAGWTYPLASTESMPVQERFYLGGSQTVRSFEQDDLGPRATKRRSDGTLRTTEAASGGEFYSLGNVELRIPVWGALETALFFDAGNIVRFHDDPLLRDYRFAVGTGLRIRTPLGPIRLDYGWNPDRRDDEDGWALHLAVGYAF
ncbi:MAG: BamA/TamA family outer membrane protein [Planctomycetota bacterium]